MRLFEFVPIVDPIVDGESLIEQIFGPEFCVVDETGRLHTTAHNQNLLRRAVVLLAQAATADRAAVEDAMAALSARAEIITQQDYDLAVHRELLAVRSDFADELSSRAGSLV